MTHRRAPTHGSSRDPHAPLATLNSFRRRDASGDAFGVSRLISFVPVSVKQLLTTGTMVLLSAAAITPRSAQNHIS